MAFIAAWLAFPESWTAVAWCALAAGLAWAGVGLLLANCSIKPMYCLRLEWCARCLSMSTTLMHMGHFSLRLITVSLIPALLYLTAHWSLESGTGASFHMEAVGQRRIYMDRIDPACLVGVVRTP